MDANQLTVEEFIARQPIYERRRRWILHPGLRLIVRLAARLEVTGLEHVPQTGGTIVMMNHISTMDPPFITAVIGHRHCITMAKIETKDNLLIETTNNWWGNFKVRRGEVDRFALNAAIELIKHGQMLLMSPEGTRNREGLKEPKDGLAYIAQKSNAIVQPVAIAGVLDWRERLMRLRRIYARINFGRPFRFRAVEGDRLTKAMRAQMMREAMYQLALAIPEDYASLRGHYADVANATTDTLEFL
ncbi:MAG: lysophospholipid acyltransferase family protein [Anaerolineae bacterium]